MSGFIVVAANFVVGFASIFVPIVVPIQLQRQKAYFGPTRLVSKEESPMWYWGLIIAQTIIGASAMFYLFYFVLG